MDIPQHALQDTVFQVLLLLLLLLLALVYFTAMTCVALLLPTLFSASTSSLTCRIAAGDSGANARQRLRRPQG